MGSLIHYGSAAMKNGGFLRRNTGAALLEKPQSPKIIASVQQRFAGQRAGQTRKPS
ncbi:MAG TPA: hypothetical protein VF503_30935 [Sphingobium sp.]|uniref:hypothetical protein n=1 Tax=Sphingobium sp. TaxID=1912891 RepID=UPI002ED3A02F